MVIPPGTYFDVGIMNSAPFEVLSGQRCWRIIGRTAMHDDSGQWFRSYGNDEQGLVRVRIASINDLPIAAADRKYGWLLGRRPDGHPGLSDLVL
jgi:nuclear transport factor 2 (NTF2) superfamily protein